MLSAAGLLAEPQPRFARRPLPPLLQRVSFWLRWTMPEPRVAEALGAELEGVLKSRFLLPSGRHVQDGAGAGSPARTSGLSPAYRMRDFPCPSLAIRADAYKFACRMTWQLRFKI